MVWTNLIKLLHIPKLPLELLLQFTTCAAPDSLGMGPTGVVIDSPKPVAGWRKGGQEELTQ